MRSSYGYRHGDWLGSARLLTSFTQTLEYDTAYAPFGENYAGSGPNQDLGFTQGATDSLGILQTAGTYDFPFRKYPAVQGRWMTPDPSGMAAADPTNPQSWNRYAYVTNNPLNATDPLGLETCPECGPDFGGGGGHDCDPILSDFCDDWGGNDLGCGMLDPCDNPCPLPGICESPERGSGPSTPRRGGGVSPTMKPSACRED